MSNPISWTDATWNPVHGCTPISPGCKNCYAQRMARRLSGRCGYPQSPADFDVTLRPDRLEQPLHWRKPRRVFVVSMGDLFHEDVPFEFIARVFSVMHEADGHTFQLLTKRPQRMLEFISGVKSCHGYWTHNGDFPELSPRGTGIVVSTGAFGWPLDNVHLGVTVCNQDEMWKIDTLLQIPAAVRFVSCEPLLSGICIPPHWFTKDNPGGPQPNGEYRIPSRRVGLDLVIVGGETGPGARPMHPDWARSIRDQCQAADVPFHFKQWGGPHRNGWVIDGQLYSGHLLDGIEHREFPR